MRISGSGPRRNAVLGAVTAANTCYPGGYKCTRPARSLKFRFAPAFAVDFEIGACESVVVRQEPRAKSRATSAHKCRPVSSDKSARGMA